MKKKRLSRTFRPWPENQVRLELADKGGLNVSELINEVINKHFADHVKEKALMLSASLGVPSR
jgi:hypothetical protein